MANKIGVVLALDNERQFTQGMKNAQQATKELDSGLKDLSAQYKDSANSLEYLSKKQDILKQKEEALNRAMTAAKTGQSNAKKAYQEQAQALEKLQKEYDEASKSLQKMSKSDPGYDKQARQVQQLSNALDKQTANYLKAEGRLSSWDNKVNKTEGDIKKNSSALEQNSKYMAEASNSADKCATSIDKVGKESKETATETKQMGESLKTALAIKGVELASSAIREVGEAAVEAAQYAVEVGSNFEASMSKVEAISGASGSELTALSDKAKELGSTTKFSATEVADAMTYMGMAGWKSSEMLSGIDGILQLAAASGEELATVSDIVTDDLTAFGMSASDAGRMADVLAAASANSNTNVSMMGETFKYAGAVAGSFGYSLEDVSVAAGLMANAGIKGSQAGTTLRSIFTRLATDAGASSTKLGALGTLTEKLGVQFYEADGTMRPFKNVLNDLRGAWSGLSQAEQTNYANTIAGKNAMSGFLALVNSSDADFAKLTSAIENSSGAAERMAGVMQDNLQGSITRMKSAAEGLGIAVYDGVKEPLTGLADLAADALGALTDAITPEKSELESFTEEVKANAEAAAEGFKASQETINTAVADVGNLEHYKTVIVDLNEQEHLNEYQKYQLQAAVEALSGSIPELGDAFNDTTGKVDLEREAIEKLIEAQQNQIIENAKMQAAQQEMEALFNANLAVAQAQAAKNAAEGRKKILEDEKTELLNLANEYQSYADNVSLITPENEKRMGQIADRMKELGYNANESAALLQHGTAELDKLIDIEKATVDENDRLLKSSQETADKAKESYDTLNDSIETAAKTTIEQTKATTEQTLAVERRNDAARQSAYITEETIKEQHSLKAAEREAAQEAAGWTAQNEKVQEGAENTSKSVHGMADAIRGAGAAVRDDSPAWIEAAKDFSEIASRAEESMKQLQSIAATSAENIRNGWESLKQSASETLTFSIETKFDGGEDLTTETMNENLQSQLDGYQQYVENLKVLREAVAEGIITPEFFANLESQGTSAANEIQHMAWTLENQENGVEQVKGISDKWTQALDMKASIAAMIAGDQAALAQGLASFGSSAMDFSALSDAINAGLAGADEATQAKIQELAATAQEVGATIPEGLTEAIQNGDIDAAGIESQLNASITGALEGLADIAQESGAALPEGLVSAIEAGTADVQAAYDTLVGSIATATGATANITQTAQEAFTDPLANGITAGQEAVVTAAQGTGQAAAEGFASGMTAGQESAVSSATAVATAANTAFTQQESTFVASGTAAASAYGRGITAGQPGAVSAAGAVAQAAKSAVSSYENSFYSVGYNMAAGVANGIAAGQSLAVNAAVNMVVQAINAVKAEAEMHSPSRKWANLVGKQMAAGTAMGLKKGTPLAKAAAKDMAKGTLNATTAWLKKNKKAMESGKEDMRYFWAQMVAITKQGSKNYEKLLAKAEKAAISTNFGVSWKTGKKIKSGKNKGKDELKNAETYYGEIYTAAQNYFDMLTMNQDMSLKQELTYWTKVRDSLRKGTKAYVSASQKIKSLQASIKSERKKSADDAAKKAEAEAKAREQAAKDAAAANDKILSDAEDYFDSMSAYRDISITEEIMYWEKVQKTLKAGSDAYVAVQKKLKTLKANIGTFEVASDMLSKWQVYHELSEQAITEYWDIVRQQYEEGTDDRIRADEQYYNAKKAKDEKLKDLEADHKEKLLDIEKKYNDKLKDLEDDRIKRTEEANERLADALEDRTKEIAGAFDLFEAFESESDSGSALLFNMKTQAEGYQFWMDQLEALASRGILGDELMQELTERGPKDTAALVALGTLSDEQLKEYSDAYERKMDLSREQATEDTEDLRKEIVEELRKIQEEYAAAQKAAADEYKTERDAQIKAYNEAVTSITTKLGATGTAIAAGIKTVVSDQTSGIVAAMNIISTQIDKANDAAAQKAAQEAMAKAQAAQAQAVKEAQAREAALAAEDKRQAELKAAEQKMKQEEAARQAAQKAAAEKAEKEAQAKAAAQAAADEAKSKKQNAKNIITSSGTKRSKTITAAEKKAHDALWQHIVSTYGYAPKTATIKDLFSAFGIKRTTSNGTDAERKKLLAAMKKVGARRGTRHAGNLGVWMDEEGLGSEMVISRADNAVLTRLPASSDTVIPANLTDNLWKWGGMDPARVMSALARRQAELSAYVRQMAGVASISSINGRLLLPDTGYSSSGSNSGEGVLRQMLDLMAQYLPHIEDQRDTYLDKDKVTKSMSDNMSKDMALRARRSRI